MQLEMSAPWWVVLLCVLVIVLIAYNTYRRPAVALVRWRRLLLIGLRTLSLLALFFILLKPVRTEVRPFGDTVLPVLVDKSKSMRIGDVEGGTRLAQALKILRDEIIPSLPPEIAIEVLGFDETLSEIDIDSVSADGVRSNLFQALSEVNERYRNRTVPGVVVISDGVETGPTAAESISESSDLRIFPVGIGARQPVGDREILSFSSGNVRTTNSFAELTLTVVSHGLGVDPIEVRLFEDGQLSERRSVTPNRDGAPVRTVFLVEPRPDSPTLYSVEIPPLSDELVVANNFSSVLVPPAVRARRLLMVEGAPAHEHSFLKRVWLADQGIAVDAVVRKGLNDQGEPTFYVQGDAGRTGALSEGYPLNRDVLFQYDGVIFANVKAEYFSTEQLKMTADFVSQRGGGLLLLGDVTLAGEGFGSSVLDPVIPVGLGTSGRFEDFRLLDSDSESFSLTSNGLSHAMMQLKETIADTRDQWRRMPSLGGLVNVGDLKPGATVLLELISTLPGRMARPVVVVQRYGSGRAMVFAGQASWRWRMLLSSSDRTFERFWGQVVRWVTGSALDQVSVTSHGGAGPGDVVQLELRVRDADYTPVGAAEPIVTITGPSQDTETVNALIVDEDNGLYQADFRPSLAGIYRIEASVELNGTHIGKADEWLLVGGSDPELRDPWLDESALQRLALESGGRYIGPEEINELPDAVLTDARKRVVSVSHPLWHTSWFFSLLVILLLTEWTLRRAWGMR